MIKVISSEGCSNCEKVRRFMENFNIPHEYIQINDFQKDEQKRIKEFARKSGQLSFPVIIEDDKLIKFEDIRNIYEKFIIKRNNKRVAFDENRIVNAILGAMNETDHIDEDLVKSIAHEILLESTRETNVESIQDAVENKLLNSDRKDVAKRYILYREEKSKERLTRVEKEGLLSDEFISKYKHLPSPMTPLGSFVYYRTYSRWIPELNRREYWWETVKRAVEYNCSLAPTTKEEAERLYDNIFNLRQFLSGRTLFAGGSQASLKYSLSNFNCSLRVIDDYKAFGEIFYVLMLGVGAGVRVLPEDVEKLAPINKDVEIIHKDYSPVPKNERQENTSLVCKNDIATIVVGDSKEGWMSAVDNLFNILTSNCYKNIHTIIFNYDNVRPKGERLKTFGGRASGHNSIKTMFIKIDKVLKSIDGKGYVRLSPLNCLDIANIIGENVVSGGTRRTSEVGLFDVTDKDILQAKNNLYQQVNGKWEENTDISHRKMSNNSIIYKEKPTREQLHWQVNTMRYTGEPGLMNLEEVKRRNPFAMGGNP